jgi:hypothetical protein
MKARLQKKSMLIAGMLGLSAGALWANTYKVPGDFSSLSAAISSSNVVKDDIISIVGNLTENGSMRLEKSGITFKGNSNTIQMNSNLRISGTQNTFESMNMVRIEDNQANLIFLDEKAEDNAFRFCNFSSAVHGVGSVALVNLSWWDSYRSGCKNTEFSHCNFDGEGGTGISAEGAQGVFVQYCNFNSFYQGINAGEYFTPYSPDIKIFNCNFENGSNTSGTSCIYCYGKDATGTYPMLVQIDHVGFNLIGTTGSYPIYMEGIVQVQLKESTFSNCPCEKAWLKSSAGKIETSGTINFNNNCTAGDF